MIQSRSAVVIALLAAVAAGCGDTILAPAEVAGTYMLVSAAGGTLPQRLSSGSCVFHVEGGALSVRGDGATSLWVAYRARCAGYAADSFVVMEANGTLEPGLAFRPAGGAGHLFTLRVAGTQVAAAIDDPVIGRPVALGFSPGDQPYVFRSGPVRYVCLGGPCSRGDHEVPDIPRPLEPGSRAR